MTCSWGRCECGVGPIDHVDDYWDDDIKGDDDWDDDGNDEERWTCIGAECLHPSITHMRQECFTAEMAEAFHAEAAGEDVT